MLKIDIHTHILPKTLPKFKERFGYGGFIELDHHKNCCARMIKDDGTFFREVESNCWDPDTRIKEFTQSDVHVQVLSTVPVMFSYWAKAKDTLEISKFLNDHISDIVAKYPKRFVGLGTLPMQDAKLAVQEMERSLRSGLRGFQIGTNINRKNLSDEEFFPIFKRAEELGAALFVHPWGMMNEEHMKKYWLPWLVGMPAEISLAISSLIFGGVLEKCANLKIAFAHGGGAFPASLGRIQHGFEARPDLCAVDSSFAPKSVVDKIYVDSLVHDSKVLRLLIQIFGAKRIALGTDYPFPLGEAKAGECIESLTELSVQDKEQLYSGTALEWLGLKQGDFL